MRKTEITCDKCGKIINSTDFTDIDYEIKIGNSIYADLCPVHYMEFIDMTCKWFKDKPQNNDV